MKPALDEPASLAAIRLACASEDAAVAYMESQRWGNTPKCPRAGCGSVNVYRMMGKDGKPERNRRWRCRHCLKMFSVKVGTVMEDSRLPVRVWVYIFWRAAASKNGCAALELQRDLRINYRSALFALQRVRYAMSDWNDPNPSKLVGTVEADETYVGGKPRLFDRKKSVQGRGSVHKQPVLGMVERDGRLRMAPVRNVTTKSLKAALTENVDTTSRLMTDDWHAYYWVGRLFKERGHHIVRHSKREYTLPGGIFTNTIESAFSMLKRGLSGTYHAVSRKHLHRYCDEFGFRWSYRRETDLARAMIAVRKGEGKRLTLAEVEAPLPKPESLPPS